MALIAAASDAGNQCSKRIIDAQGPAGVVSPV